MQNEEMKFIEAVVNFINMSKVFKCRRKALNSMGNETIELEAGKLLGGKMTLKIEFDYAEMEKQRNLVRG